jgi:site-specific DNA recombinase
VKHPQKGGYYEVDAEEAAMVREIFALYTTDGLSLKQIARQLTEKRVPTCQDRRKQHERKYGPGIRYESAVARILSNTAYIGTVYWGKHERQTSPSNPDKKTAWRRKAPETWQPIPVPPIIDETIFQMAQARKRRNLQEKPRNKKYEYLLSNGRLRCGVCGYVMAGNYLKRKNFSFYRCCKPKYIGEPCKGYIAAEKVEREVWQAVDLALRNPTLIAAEIAHQQAGTATEQGTLQRERRAYEQQMAQYDKDIARWERAYLAEAIDVDDFKTKRAEILSKQRTLKAELACLDAQQRLLEQMDAQTSMLTEYCGRVAKSLHTLTMGEKKLALEALSIVVHWYPNRPLEIKGSIPLTIEETTSHALWRCVSPDRIWQRYTGAQGLRANRRGPRL